ncbi:MAG: AAA family ATPase [Actinomycetota bacterium]
MAVRLSRDADRPFVGRARELAAAADLMADPDQVGIVLIGGESGLGKTRLAEEIIATAPDDVCVIRAGAVPRATPIPFELVRSAVDTVRSVDAPRLDDAADLDGAAEIAEAADLAVTGDAAATGHSLVANRVREEAERLRMMAAGPTVFLFEDVHWADPESLEVIDRLLAAGPLGASILITYRPNHLHPDHPTSGFLRRAERRSRVVQFRLEPLRRAEVGEYLAAAGRSVAGQTVEHVHNRTGGNPLLLSELVAATAGDADLTAGLPWTLAEILRPEIDGLEPRARAVAEAVAVLGADVGFDLLAAAVDATEDDLLACLRTLVDLGILTESGPDRFGFRHELVREAVADGLFTREHRRIHAAVHDALLASGSDDVVALVAHATGAGRMKEAADAARDAAVRALDGGRTHQAMAFAEQALLVHTDDVELLRIAVLSGWMTGQDRAALHHLDRWEELAGAHPVDRAEVIHHRVRLLWEEGDRDAADRAAAELAAIVEELPEEVAKAQALADLAQHNMLTGRIDAAIVVADQAIELAATVGPAADGAARQARAERASARIHYGDERRAASEELFQLAREAEAAGDHIVASRALHNIPLRASSAAAREHLEWMREASTQAGLTCIGTGGYRIGLLKAAAMEGDRSAYEPQLAAALEDLDDPYEIILEAAFSAIDAGRLDEAERLAERLPLRVDSPFYSPWWRSATLAAIRMEQGDPAPIRRWLQDIAEDPHGNKLVKTIILRTLTPLLEAGLRQEIAAAIGTIGDAEWAKPAWTAVQAELRGDLAAAEDGYRASLTDDIGRHVIDRAELHLGLARVATAAGRDAKPHLEAAADTLCCWPGRRLDHIVALLGEAREIESPQVLTPREREVATLVAKGLTNGGIADQLFISTKTASVHVSNILAKLGMASRAEIASWVAGGGMD